MSTMSEKALTYFLEKGYNCAESVYAAALDTVGKPVTAEGLRSIAAFGGGMGCGESCGALCGGIGAIGVLTITEGTAHGCPALHPLAKAFATGFLAEFEELRCAALRPRFFTQERRCAALVARSAALLERVLAEQGGNHA